jgi:hypothetical protein
MNRRWAQFVLAAIPALALSLAVPFVNRQEPDLAGAPFLFIWIVGWVVAMPLFLFAAYRIQQRT